jgi:YesN/AraC family two-component response regulator
VDTSFNPEYAFELALNKNYDLMIFGFSMPIINGMTLFLLLSKVYENASATANDATVAGRIG